MHVLQVLDEATGLYFYYNVRTGVSQWRKPRCLGSLDIPVSVTPRSPYGPTTTPLHDTGIFPSPVLAASWWQLYW